MTWREKSAPPLSSWDSREGGGSPPVSTWLPSSVPAQASPRCLAPHPGCSWRVSVLGCGPEAVKPEPGPCEGLALKARAMPSCELSLGSIRAREHAVFFCVWLISVSGYNAYFPNSNSVHFPIVLDCHSLLGLNSSGVCVCTSSPSSCLLMGI